jgi:hypothetical protein
MSVIGTSEDLNLGRPDRCTIVRHLGQAEHLQCPRQPFGILRKASLPLFGQHLAREVPLAREQREVFPARNEFSKTLLSE